MRINVWTMAKTYKHKQVGGVFERAAREGAVSPDRGRRFDRLLSRRLRHNEPSEGEGSACWAGYVGTVLARCYFLLVPPPCRVSSF